MTITARQRMLVRFVHHIAFAVDHRDAPGLEPPSFQLFQHAEPAGNIQRNAANVDGLTADAQGGGLLDQRDAPAQALQAVGQRQPGDSRARYENSAH